MIVRGVEQGSPEWLALRAGKLGSSKAAVTMGGLDTAGLAAYVQDLAWERVYGPVPQGFISAAMKHGTDTEAEARDWYAFETGRAVETVTLVKHDEIGNVIWSPDGLSGSGAIEIKCPFHKSWMDVKKTLKVPAEYRWQCRWAMWVGGLEWMDFVCYHPQAGGIIIPCEITESEKQQMAERVALLEPKVQAWVNVLKEKKCAA